MKVESYCAVCDEYCEWTEFSKEHLPILACGHTMNELNKGVARYGTEDTTDDRTGDRGELPS